MDTTLNIQMSDEDVGAELEGGLEPPYQLLLMRVLQCAVEDLKQEGTVRESARRWIFDDESEEVMSVHWVCHALGLHPDYFRRKLSYKPSRQSTSPPILVHHLD